MRVFPESKIVTQIPAYTLVALPEFDRNQARVQKVGTVWLHPPDDALPEAIQIPCALTEGPQQILRRTKPQRFRGCPSTISL